LREISEVNSQFQDVIRVCKVIQYFAWTQWQSLRGYCSRNGVTVIGDMPIYVSLESADVWSNSRLFKLDQNKRPVAVSGVPPDYFSATGQLWNNPVYNWDVHQREGFSWWTKRMRHLLSLYDIVRIDHFRGLVQFWEIPAGETSAINGAWQDVPTISFFDTLIEQVVPFSVICEDLGIITDDVREVIKHYGFFVMKVLQFAFSEDETNPYLPHNYDTNCLVYTGTHDNLPTLGWLNTVAGERERSSIRQYTKRNSDDFDTVWDLIELAMKSEAVIAVFPLQDVLTLGEESRINDPSRVEGNWQWRWNSVNSPLGPALSRLKRLIVHYERI
jgi:4-alpha-glucanotransferase